MVNQTVDTYLIHHNSDIDGDDRQDVSEGWDNELDVSDSDNEEDETHIPVPSSVPRTLSSLPSSGATLDFRSYECFTNIRSREPIKDNYEGNINIQRWSYDDEPDLRVGIRFTDKGQVVYAVRQ